jgi:phage terminase large subunit-like protein
MQMLGVDLMPWQRLVLDTALEINPLTKRLAYREVRLTVPRQQGKSTLAARRDGSSLPWHGRQPTHRRHSTDSEGCAR